MRVKKTLHDDGVWGYKAYIRVCFDKTGLDPHPADRIELRIVLVLYG